METIARFPLESEVMCYQVRERIVAVCQIIELDAFACNRLAATLSSLLRQQIVRDSLATLSISIDGGRSSSLVFEIRHPSEAPPRTPGLEHVFHTDRAGEDDGQHYLRLVPDFSSKTNELVGSRINEVADCLQWKSREQLLEELEASNKALRLHSEELEEIVEKRTAELQEAKEMAEKANSAKSDFLSNMSHELRTPLNGVLGYVQILQRDRTLGPSQKQSLESISNCGEHLLQLINDVLDLSKIEAGKLELSLEPTDLSNLIDGVRDIVKPRAEGKGLEFVVKTSPEVPRGVITDPMKLRQVLINLLGNSVKFTQEGRISLKVAEQPKGTLRFDVEDTGMGIASDKLAAIFNPFQQDEGGKTEGGTGLGLAISRRISEALGGSLEATSELGEGSTFTVTHPLEETDEIKEGGFSAVASESSVYFKLPEGASCKVLVADDREANREILDQILTGSGFETVLTNDGVEALEELRKQEFDIFLCDVRMPRMNGLEVVREVRKDEKLKSSIVFAVTASVFPEFQNQAKEAGFDEFVMKPIRVAELAEKMSKSLGIEFVYEDTESGAADGEGDDLNGMFAAVTGELRSEVQEAARLKNLTKVGALAKQLKESEGTSAAGQHLEELVATFNFAGFDDVVSALDVSSND